MKKIILGLAAASAVAVAAPGLASADNSNNGNTNDAQGWCVTNHMHNGFNGDHHGIGWIRSGQTGSRISAEAGNRVPAVCVSSANG